MKGSKIDLLEKPKPDVAIKTPDQTEASCISGNRQRNQTKVLIGRLILFVTVSCVLFVGIVINILQVLLLISIRLSDHPKWRSIHKKINSYLIYVLFAPPVTMLYCWSNVELNIKLADMELIEIAKGPLLGIIIPNHSYELDYMTCFVMADQLGNLGAYKSFSKDEIKYLPVLGWALWMSDIIFVKRNWKQDRLTIASQLNELFSYEQTLLGLFAEGTRWTPEKHRASVEFAESRGIKPLKYHLIPRSRGFVFTMRHYLREIVNSQRIDEKMFRIFNLQIFMQEKQNFGDFVEGRQLRADIFCEEIKLSDEVREEILRSKDENDCPKVAQFIQDIYQRKDKLVEEYKSNGNKFVVPPGGGRFPFKHRKLTIFISTLSLLYTLSTLFYLGTTGSYTFWSLLIVYMTCCALFQQRIDQESRLKRDKTPRNSKQMEYGSLEPVAEIATKADRMEDCAKQSRNDRYNGSSPAY